MKISVIIFIVCKYIQNNNEIYHDSIQKVRRNSPYLPFIIRLGDTYET